MIRRSTVLILSSLTSFITIASGSAKAAVQQPATLSERAPNILIAQQDPQATPPQTAPAPAAPDPFSINPANSTNTGTAVPNVTSPPTRPTANALQSTQQAESVRALQEQLQQRGYYDGPVDGLYGSGTERAVQSFQQDTGLPSTGEIDIPTLQELSPTSQAASTEEGAADAPTGSSEGTESGDLEAEVSEEGAEATEAPTPDNEGNDPTPANDAETGFGQWLWPGVALVAALGSFGIGFALFNRSKGEDELILENDAPWGAISPNLPTAAAAAVGPTGTVNGAPPMGTAPPAPVETAAYGTPYTAKVTPGTNGQGTNGTGPISAALDAAPQLETTRLAKVNIIDELVEDLGIPDPNRRRKAIWELGQRGNSAAVQPLVNAMVGADSKEKSLILAALSEIGIRSLKPMNRALAIALQDDNPEVRKNAIRDLTRIYDLVAQISRMGLGF
ncbi:MAG: peptidoglycan-binding protein [Cyanobacteria bacterium J06632_22]